MGRDGTQPGPTVALWKKARILCAFSMPPSVPSQKIVMNESALLVVLAAIQFTHIMDFMIMMPLGPQFMRAFAITPTQFGLLVSSYSFSAGFAGFAAGFFMDRFDRRRALLTLYAGFGIGTLSCALAPNYALLMLARTVAGAFGGVAGSVVLAIVGDVIPLARRGHAMGVIMTSFSMAAILGLPVGLTLADAFGWHAPFFLLGGLALVIQLTARRYLPVLPAHAGASRTHDAWASMKAILSHPNHLCAFALVAVLTASGSLIYPFLSPSMVTNAALPENRLSLLYLVGGAATFFSSRYFGRLSDRFGKLRVFGWLALLSAIPTLVVTNMVPSPVAVVVAVTALYMMFSSGRFVPSMAMVTASVESRYRGGFMSVNSAVQQISAGVATAGASFVGGERRRRPHRRLLAHRLALRGPADRCRGARAPARGHRFRCAQPGRARCARRGDRLRQRPSRSSCARDPYRMQRDAGQNRHRTLRNYPSRRGANAFGRISVFV
jgi:predicted MFS family arabinose efflux permease